MPLITLTKPIVVNGSIIAAGTPVDLPLEIAGPMIAAGSASWVGQPPASYTPLDDQPVRNGGPVIGPAGVAAPSVWQSGGRTVAEGYQLRVIDEVISHVGNAALTKALTTQVPAGAVILAVQANADVALTGGGTTVRFGVGVAADPDKYGNSAALTKNAKINTIPAHAVLGAPEALVVAATTGGGAAGDTALTVGAVRVRVVYAQAVSLADVA